VVRDENSFVGKESNGWKIGIIAGFIGIALVAVTIGVVYLVRKVRNGTHLASQPLLGQ
jgi:hypothetical protein